MNRPVSRMVSKRTENWAIYISGGWDVRRTVQRRSVITGRRSNRGMTLRKQSWEWFKNDSI